MPGETINLNKKESRKLVERVTSTYMNQVRQWQKVYDEYEDGYNYLGGNQYTSEQKAWYTELRRPIKVFNLYFNIYNNIMGDFFQNDQRTRVHTKSTNNPELARNMEDVLTYINEQNDIQDEFAQVQAAGLNKMGVLSLDYSDDREIEGGINIRAVDEFEFMFEDTALHYFQDDAVFQIRKLWLLPEQITHLWPNHRKEIKESFHFRKDNDSAFKESDEVSEKMALMMDSNYIIDKKNDRLLAIEFNEMEYDNVEVFYDLDTGAADVWQLEGKKADIYRRIHPNHEILKQRARVKKRSYVLPALNMLLEHRYADIQDQKHDYVTFSAYNSGKKTIRNFGVFRNAKDPQDDHNEWRNVSRHLMNLNSNPGKIMNLDAVVNKNDAKNFGNVPGVNLYVDSTVNDISQVVKLMDYSNLPFGPDQLSQEAAGFLEKITGVTLNFQGSSEQSSESGTLFANRVKQAAKAFIGIHRNWSRTKRRLYNKAIKYTQIYWTDPKYFAVTDYSTRDLRDVEINTNPLNNINLTDYEVVADDQDNSPTARTLRFMKKFELHNAWIQSYGPQATDPAWLLSDSDPDLGDTRTMIERAELSIQMQNAQLQSSMQQMALQQEANEVNAQIGTAKKLQELESAAESSEQIEQRP